MMIIALYNMIYRKYHFRRALFISSSVLTLNES